MKFGTTMSLISAMCIAGCSGGDDDRVLEDGVNGSGLAGIESCVQTEENQSLLCGIALAADGVTPVIGAEISLAANSSAKSDAPTISLRGIQDSEQCLTDSQGEYSCILPDSISGITSFELTADGFGSQNFQETIMTGEVAIAQPQVLTADSTVQWAVVPGEFDGVQVLLAQLKGCTLNDELGNPWDINNTDSESARGSTDCESKGLRVLDSNETAFFTDGSLDQFDALFINCAADMSFVPDVNEAIEEFNQDGNHVYFSDLSDSWLSDVFPGKINFAGNATSTNPNFAANVVDPNLASVIGDDIELVFDFSVWTAMDSVSDDATVYIEGDITEISEYEGVKPITVGFKPDNSEACVFYTSYHIEGASTGSDQELAIKFLVQNIEDVCV